MISERFARRDPARKSRRIGRRKKASAVAPFESSSRFPERKFARRPRLRATGSVTVTIDRGPPSGTIRIDAIALVSVYNGLRLCAITSSPTAICADCRSRCRACLASPFTSRPFCFTTFLAGRDTRPLAYIYLRFTVITKIAPSRDVGIKGVFITRSPRPCSGFIAEDSTVIRVPRKRDRVARGNGRGKADPSTRRRYHPR